MHDWTFWEKQGAVSLRAKNKKSVSLKEVFNFNFSIKLNFISSLFWASFVIQFFDSSHHYVVLLDHGLKPFDKTLIKPTRSRCKWKLKQFFFKEQNSYLLKKQPIDFKEKNMWIKSIYIDKWYWLVLVVWNSNTNWNYSLTILPSSEVLFSTHPVRIDSSKS